ncbi:NAD(P)/FAD-dependent oxidoreductase [Persicitalea jodogahamensis]|uniref:FAD-dependent oxidoreductase n=1 Tax=Persicitalea jodogahamensis TaxID=402147 RepID=A0A8J3D2S5_9BACT|nr:FAD-binding oxidoreductase [Persicitalea jodogahamensis]GHB71859.1 FAD-dependent oxidoreductase [Persicitalea jodogahamensis]
MKISEYDYLIIGQGVAGTTLAWHLIQAGKRVLVVGDSSRPSASNVAAGIYNPLTGRKLVKTWLADEIFPYAVRFYNQIGESLSVQLVYPQNIFRPYRSSEERDRYLSYVSDGDLAEYIAEESDSQAKVKGLNAPHGGLEVKGSGWVDLKELIKNSKNYFIENNQYAESSFETRDLLISDKRVTWKGVDAGKVIFCQGYDARENTLFNWLPFNPVKGQILDVTFDDYSADKIVNQGIFILPSLTKTEYRVGATYSWHDLDWESTEDGRAYLENKLQPLVPGSYTINKQQAGIRPSCKDRRPLVGMHPEHKAVGIFNGLGTKGVTLAPYFANEFVNHLCEGTKLNPEANIARYFSLYYH